MVGMQMAHEDHREIAELRSRLSEADIGSSARIDEDLRLRTNPEKIAGIGPILDEARRAGTQDLHGDGIARAGLRQSARGRRNRQQQSGDYRTHHECTSRAARHTSSISTNDAERLCSTPCGRNSAKADVGALRPALTSREGDQAWQ